MNRDWTLLRLVLGGLLVGLFVTLVYKGPVILGWTSAERPRVVLIQKMIDESSTFWCAVRDGAVSAAEDSRINLSVRGPSSEMDVDGQIRILEEAINEKPAVILLAAGDFNRLVPSVRRAMEQAIPVLTIDSFINSADARSRIGTDNVEAGRKCARALQKFLAPGARVAVFSYIKGSSTAMDRERGLAEGLGSQYQVLPTRYSNAENELAYQQARDILKSYPDLGGMVALNEPTLLGVAKALRESGRAARVPLVGVDNAFAVMKYIEDGTVRDTIVQQPFNMGYLGVMAARRLIDRQAVEPVIDTGSVDIDKASMFLQQNQKLLFPVGQ